MNPIDAAIAFVAPEAGERRIKARARIKAVMNYDAASKGRRTYGWKAPGTDADAASQGGRAQLRNLSRDMIRNRWMAARAQGVVAANVVGTGITWSLDADSDKVRDAADMVLRRHLGTTAIDAYREQNLAGLQRVVMNAVFADGEVLVRRRLRNQIYEPDLALPFQLELIEPDLLDTAKTSQGANQVIDGVEYGPTGRIVAYHLYREHPGGVTMLNRARFDSVRVDAADILHIRRIDRPGQLRGVPWLAPVMMTLGELSDYQEAEILKQRMASLLAVVVTAEENTDQYGSKVIDELAPGAVLGLKPGQDVKFNDPPTVTGYGDFMQRGLAAIAAGVGITYEALSGDLSGTNFTSFRAGRMEMDRNVETWQQHVMIAQFCEGVARWIREAWPVAAASSPLGREIRKASADRFTLEWTAPRRALVDPNKEIPAVLKSIEGGLTSRQRAQRQLGYDPDLIRRERIEDETKDAAASPAGDGSGLPGAGADTSETEGQTNAAE